MKWMSYEKHWAVLVLGEYKEDYVVVEFVFGKKGKRKDKVAMGLYTKSVLDNDFKAFGHTIDQEAQAAKAKKMLFKTQRLHRDLLDELFKLF